MQCIAFDTRKRCTWALVQSETGKHSSLLPTPYSSLIAVCYCLADRAFRDVPELQAPGFSGGGWLTSVT